jgi:N-acetylated-alpha-linked acidic dipeptidase
MKILALVLALQFASAQADIILGFDPSSSEAQREAEAMMDAAIDARQMDEWLQTLSAAPHHVGSVAGKENVRFMAGLFESWGYEVEIEEYEILLPTPRVRELELLAPEQFTASLTEDSLDEDPSTFNRETLLPPYNAFSVDGEAEGELVFVNYGIPEDYEVLERNGVDVRGKIAIAKYGKSWRGIKPKLAAEKGAIATIIYSDPADDGYGAGDAYPRGPYKHESGVQRGSVMDMPTYPGDVLTPGVGATRSAKRLNREDAPTLTKIPVLPISHRDALPLLSALGGEVVPPQWRGALPITYHFGPGPARVRLKAEFDWNRVTAYNVIARLEGSDVPDEWVIRGNHHDGWNHGAADPNSGLVAMLAEARAIAALARGGMPPRRTLIYAAWDAEEPGLIGSTEWVEHHAAELKRKTVAYINTDGTRRGFIGIGGSHTLERFFNQVIEEVDDPLTGIGLKERKRAHEMIFAEDEKARSEARDRADLRIYPMGSGSDYTPFLQHLGIASAHFGFSGESSGGSYHTLYDTYEHYSRWHDPGMSYGATLAKVTGRVALRLANAPRLPFEFQGFADNVAKYLNELQELAEHMREETDRTNRLIRDGVYAAALNPGKALAPPAEKPPVPHFNFSPLMNALDGLREAADRFEAAARAHAGASEEINRLLYTSERLLTRDAGLSGRPWYRHHLYAPGFYTGYGVKTLPGVREAIEQREYTEVDSQIGIAAEVLNAVSGRITSLSQMLEAQAG